MTKSCLLILLSSVAILPVAFGQAAPGPELPAYLPAGRWSHCITKWTDRKRIFRFRFADREHAIIANACRELEFMADYTGYIKMGGTIEHFKWIMEGNKVAILNIMSPDKSTSTLLADGIYTVAIYPEKLPVIEIALTNSKGTSYILRK